MIDLFTLTSIAPAATGLPFVVWVGREGVVKVSRGPAPEFISPEGAELELLSRWIDVNRQTLADFWEGRIEYSEDVLAKLKAI